MGNGRDLRLRCYHSICRLEQPKRNTGLGNRFMSSRPRVPSAMQRPRAETFCVKDPKLETWLEEQLPLENVLDVQRLWSGRELPGLSKCATPFSTLTLSETEQCSNWSTCPLCASQLECVGLDATILLGIVAEHNKNANSVVAQIRGK